MGYERLEDMSIVAEEFDQVLIIRMELYLPL